MKSLPDVWDISEMEFIDAYADNTKLQSDLVLEDRPVARAMVRLVEALVEDEEWSGLIVASFSEFDEIALTNLT